MTNKKNITFFEKRNKDKYLIMYSDGTYGEMSAHEFMFLLNRGLHCVTIKKSLKNPELR